MGDIMQLKYTCVQFTDVALNLSDSPKLRGYFGNKYSNEVLMHNHDNGKLVYEYPLVQYKIINGVPTIIGLTTGSELVLNAGIREKELIIGDKHIDLGRAEITNEFAEFGLTKEIHNYEFINPWIALNQKNTVTYRACDDIEKDELLERILIGNLISMSKSLHYDVPGRIKVKSNFELVDIHLKGVKMCGFVGCFKSNFELPKYIGLGRSVSSGFGAVLKH